MSAVHITAIIGIVSTTVGLITGYVLGKNRFCTDRERRKSDDQDSMGNRRCRMGDRNNAGSMDNHFGG